ncbi:MAG: hypothetical protein KC451_05115 [Amylibacter sp.]|nr:hypothetical protein [Amylibacter sp.]
MDNIDFESNPLFVASIGHWIRDQQRFDRVPMITSEVVSNHKVNPHFPDVLTQLSNLLRVIGDLVGEPGPVYQFSAASIQFRVGCKSEAGVIGLVKHLRESHSIGGGESSYKNSSNMQIGLTVSGWIEYERILADNNVGRKAFIAMPFGKPDLDDVWLPKLRAAVDQTGYKLERVDDNPEPGLIDTRMKLQIKSARFLLVELTHSNSGAYWEAGMAEGLGKPVIYLRRDDDSMKAHFDVEHSFRVQWDAANMDFAIETVKATIRNSMPDAIMND